MKKLTEQDVETIIKLYVEEGKTPKEIGEQFGIFNNSVTRILKRKGITRTQLIKIDEKKVKIIIDQYSLGISSELIADNLGINGSTVCRILKRNGITIRPSEDNKRKYKIEQRYFEEIDTEEKAYFLGMLYADAYLTREEVKRHSIRLTLHNKDRDVVERFSQVIYHSVARKLRPLGRR